MSKHLIPILLAVADIAEAIVCAVHADWPRTLYWASAAAITYSTVIMKS